uniref:Alpha-tocopherol transfer protein-like protein n=1 Tax=Lygus hesperus TaxID=30085 RepID=A0A0A9YG14_LYGHE
MVLSESDSSFVPAEHVGRAVAEMTEKRVTAEQEFAKNADLKKEDLATLRDWAAAQPHLPKITEEQMILFFHSCYWDIENTKSCINVYYNTRSNTPEFFSNRDAKKQNLKQALQVLHYSALPVKDPNGYQIIYHGLQQFEASKYVFADGVKMLAMAIDACAMVEGTVPGYIFLFNMKGVRLTHLTRLSVGLLRKFFVYIQEGMPVRLQAIHVVNTMPIIDKIMFMIKPFMKKELLSMLHFHYGDYSEVQKCIPKECLPKDLDGDLKSIDELHADFCEWMERMTPQFLEEENYRGESSKGKSKKEPENDLSLSNLSFD